MIVAIKKLRRRFGEFRNIAESGNNIQVVATIVFRHHRIQFGVLLLRFLFSLVSRSQWHIGSWRKTLRTCPTALSSLEVKSNERTNQDKNALRATLYCFAEFIAHSIEIHAPYTHSVHPCLLSRTHIVSGRSYARSLSRQLFGASVRLQGTAKGKKTKQKKT